MTGLTQPGRNGGTLRRGGGSVQRRISAEFFKPFEAGDTDLKLKPRAERLAALLNCGDPHVQLRTEELLLEYQYGRPTQGVEISGGGEVRFVVEVPPNETREEWLERHAANRAAADEILYGEAN